MRDFDSVSYLDNEASITAYLQAAVDGDVETPGLLNNALMDVMKARAVNQLATETGIDRQLICEMFMKNEVKPDPIITYKISAAFGVPVHA